MGQLGYISTISIKPIPFKPVKKNFELHLNSLEHLLQLMGHLTTTTTDIELFHGRFGPKSGLTIARLGRAFSSKREAEAWTFQLEAFSPFVKRIDIEESWKEQESQLNNDSSFKMWTDISFAKLEVPFRL